MRRPWIVTVIAPLLFFAACNDAPVQPAFRPMSQALVLATATLVVDDDGMGSASDCNATTPAFAAIQSAVNAAAAGDVVLVCPGSYDELVTVTTNGLTIRGVSADAVLRPHVVPVNSTLLSGSTARVILLIAGAADVTVDGLTIDGRDGDAGASLEVCGGGRPFYLGVFLRGGSGRVNNTHVTNMRSASGCSFGVFAQSVVNVPVDLAVTENVLDHYGSGGVVCTGPETSCTVTGNTLQGLGPVDNQLQTGIAVRFGATAEIRDNVIRDHWFTPHRLPGPDGGIAAKSAGIFMFGAAPASNPHILEQNTFSRNNMDVQRSLTEQVLF